VRRRAEGREDRGAGLERDGVEPDGVEPDGVNPDRGTGDRDRAVTGPGGALGVPTGAHGFPTGVRGVSVVIVNYEAGPALVRCVEGLRAEGPAELVVVDNGSADGSVDAVRRRFPDVTVLAPGANLGYGAAVNRGVAATTAPSVLVGNSDLEVPPGALAALVAVLDREPRCALAGPLIRKPGGERYPSARQFPSLTDAAGHALLGIFAPDNRFTRSYQRAELEGSRGASGDGSGTELVDWVSGACFVVRREAFEQVGGFDEAYFMYLEDVDLCWRLGQAGWQVRYAQAAEVTHLQGISTDRHPFRMIVEHHRSLLRFASRSSRGWRRLALPLIAVGIGIRALLAGVAQVTRR
jgi:N-acetylglucosaminyl-diphospho-decaprenol L-rhamnosyltransferase